MKCAIVGAGDMGLYFCERLIRKNHEVVLIEKDKNLVQNLSEVLPVQIVHKDGRLARTLLAMEIQKYDIFMSMTHDDDINLLACSLAKSFGVKKVVSRVHHILSQDMHCFNYQAHFGVDYFVNPYALSALEIAKKIRTPHGVEMEHFSRGQVEVQTFPLNEASKWVGKSLTELAMESNTRIGYIQRGTKFIIPSRDTVLNAGDLITLASDVDALPRIRTQMQSPAMAKTRVVIFSGSDVTFALARRLSNPRFKLKVIEPELSICEELVERFTNISVVQGSATSLSLLAEEQVETCDHFVACSLNDEQNIMACLQAKRAGAKNIHLVLNKPEYEPVLTQLKAALNVDNLILPKLCVYEDAMRFLFPQSVAVLGQLNQGDVAEILEIHLIPGSCCEGRTIREIAWPAGTILLVLNHRFRSKVPSATDPLIGGDSIIVIVKKENKKALLNLFAAA